MQGPVAELFDRIRLGCHSYRSGNTSLLQKTCWKKSKECNRESGPQNVQENIIRH